MGKGSSSMSVGYGYETALRLLRTWLEEATTFTNGTLSNKALILLGEKISHALQEAYVQGEDTTWEEAWEGGWEAALESCKQVAPEQEAPEQEAPEESKVSETHSYRNYTDISIWEGEKDFLRVEDDGVIVLHIEAGARLYCNGYCDLLQALKTARQVAEQYQAQNPLQDMLKWSECDCEVQDEE